MDHDDNFKTLLTTFFIEFVQAFLPKLAAYLDPASIEFLDKDVFAGLSRRKKGSTDIVVKARFKDEEAFFLVHVENQASARPDFPKRMFRYFARLHERYDLPIYPIVLFSYDSPQRAEPTEYKIVFPNKTVLDFRYTVIQLNRMSWRKFLKTPNPAAAGLMSKMKIAPQDKPKVLRECRRLLVTMKLDPERTSIVWAFAEGYLQLTTAELNIYERDIAMSAPDEQERTVQLMSTIERKGVNEGKVQLLLRQINRRFGSASPLLQERVKALRPEELDKLSEDFLEIMTFDALDEWFTRR